MRLFTGLSLESGALRQAETILGELAPTANIRWSPPQNLHLTLAFIGAWDEQKLPALTGALSEVTLPTPIPISVTGFGFFPNPHHPHSVFLTVKPDPALTSLADGIASALSTLSWTREDRPYHPHITLARIARENITQLRYQIASMNSIFPLASFEGTQFHLYESHPTPQGSIYSILRSFPTGAAAK